MKSLFFFVLALLTILSYGQDVVILNGENFDTVLSENKFVLVEFFVCV